VSRKKKVTKQILMGVLIASAGFAQAAERATNPFVKHMFTADASAHVWDDGRLYVYPSTDIKGKKGFRFMDGYHVFSTDDMINWTDHGEILHSRDVEWGIKGGGYMWAPDCNVKDGTYYYYFPHKNAKQVWEIGVATSTKPASDFTLQGFVKGCNTFCDPCVFKDDDGQFYLYAVVDAKCYAAKLKDNMMEIEGEMVHQQGVDEHREGPFVFKRNDTYYMIYPDHHKPRNEMQYSMSDSPLGPWTPKGLLMNQTDVLTMHGSVVEYKGKWYLFYHNGSLSGGKGTNRSICFDEVTFNADGTMNRVEQSPCVVP
jgi:beta-xylosidase